MDGEIHPSLLDTTGSTLDDLKQFGDRTSSFMTLYPGFQSYKNAQPGQIRFVETNKAWVVGTEPLAPTEERARLFEAFGFEAENHGKTSIMTPVTERLSQELVQRGYKRIQVGSEPVFELARYFSVEEKDPIDRFPHARTLARRGIRIREITADQQTEALSQQLRDLVESWLHGRATVPLSFLNQIDPWCFGEHKKLFVVEHGRKVLAFLSAVPVFAKHGYFFADYIRAPSTKAGTVELLFIESMRMLHHQGYREVRLGMCPLAQLDLATATSPRERSILRAMKWIFGGIKFPMNFSSIYEFKAKFKPTAWEPLFLVSKTALGPRTLYEIGRVHFPESVTKAYAVTLGRKLKRHLNPAIVVNALPRSFAQLIARTRLTLFFSALFSALHVLRSTIPEVQKLYETNGFSPASYTITSHLIAPLFHNTHYHFAGDILSFVIFGGALEILLGSGICFLVVAAGLWASNPITWGFVELVLKPVSATTYAEFLREVDYGSSNAVYAAVGALAPLLTNPRWLLMPFALNGLFLCLAHQSWLSLHHLIALACGYLFTVIIKTKRKS